MNHTVVQCQQGHPSQAHEAWNKKKTPPGRHCSRILVTVDSRHGRLGIIRMTTLVLNRVGSVVVDSSNGDNRCNKTNKKHTHGPSGLEFSTRHDTVRHGVIVRSRVRTKRVPSMPRANDWHSSLGLLSPFWLGFWMWFLVSDPLLVQESHTVHEQRPLSGWRREKLSRLDKQSKMAASPGG